jgi:hypothetical protein
VGWKPYFYRSHERSHSQYLSFRMAPLYNHSMKSSKGWHLSSGNVAKLIWASWNSPSNVLEKYGIRQSSISWTVYSAVPFSLPTIRHTVCLPVCLLIVRIELYLEPFEYWERQTDGTELPRQLLLAGLLFLFNPELEELPDSAIYQWLGLGCRELGRGALVMAERGQWVQVLWFERRLV